MDLLPAQQKMETTDSFGYWVRRRRKALDLTQGQLAERVGCAVVTLRKIEADERRPSREMAERLASSLGLPAAECGWFIAMALGDQAVGATVITSEPASAARPGSLPVPLTSIVGRDDDVVAIVAMLRDREMRLLTITGPVGVGKTRVAVEVGHQVQNLYRNGVYLVALAPVRVPEMLMTAIASTLEVRETRDRDLVQSVTDFLSTKELLLILDGFEHLLRAAPIVANLLTTCPGLQVLVTSRAALHLYGENELALPPLPLPETLGTDEAVSSPCVRLFCERARAVQADFHATAATLPAIVAICRRLDGLPLAIELAAASVRLFSPQELLARLENRLVTPEREPSGLPLRLQRLRNAIAWSYSLLTPLQRTLLARLAVFLGGTTLASAEAVCASPYVAQPVPDGYLGTLGLGDIAEGIEALLDHSLLVRQTAAGDRSATGRRCCPRCPTRLLRESLESEPRFSMLEIIREYALDQLRATGELAVVRQRHAETFVAWVGRASARLEGAEQGLWLAQLEREADNARAALRHLLETHQAELAAQMVCALGAYWLRRGHYSEGRRWVAQLLTQIADVHISASLRARTLQVAAMLAAHQGDWEMAQSLLDECLTLFDAAVDRQGMASALQMQATVALDRGNWDAAIDLSSRSLELARQNGDQWAVYRAMTDMGRAQLNRGSAEAAALFQQAFEIAQRVGHTEGVAISLVNLGWIALAEETPDRASRLAMDALRLCHLLEEREVLAECMELLGAISQRSGDPRRAAQLSGAAEAVREALGSTRPPSDYATMRHAQTVTALRSQMHATELEAAWLQGKAMCLDTMVVTALSCDALP